MFPYSADTCPDRKGVEGEREPVAADKAIEKCFGFPRSHKMHVCFNNAGPDTAAVSFYLRTMSCWSWVALFFGACRSSSMNRESGTAGRKETEMYTSHKKRNEDWEKLCRWGQNTFIYDSFHSPSQFHIDLLVKDGKREVTDTGRWLKANCLPIVLCRLCITYISRFIIITKQLSDIIIKQARGFCFL